MRRTAVAVLVVVTSTVALAQSPREQLARGHELWRQRLAKGAIASFEAATRDRATAAEAWEALGRIYTFKGWRQEGVFPGWHDEPEYRERAIAALKASLAADPSRTTAADALKEAEGYAASPTVVPPAPPAPDVQALDAQIARFREAQAPLGELEALLDRRAARQADPNPFFTAAQIALDRGDFARAEAFASRGAAAAERFIAENESAYRMDGKARGARDRSRAAALDIRGAVALARLDVDAAARHLEEAARLSQRRDVLVLFHLGELAAARRDVDGAAEHFLDALSLTGGPPPLRARAMEALAGVHAAREEPQGFEAWLHEELERRRAARREAALRSPVNRRLPPLALRTLDGRPVSLEDYRGKVLLLNFFSSW
jgi:hypothetical protein